MTDFVNIFHLCNHFYSSINVTIMSVAITGLDGYFLKGIKISAPGGTGAERQSTLLSLQTMVYRSKRPPALSPDQGDLGPRELGDWEESNVREVYRCSFFWDKLSLK